MLPPAADMTRMTIVEMPPSCARVRQAAARTRPKAAAAAAVTTVTSAKPARCEASGRPNATAPQANITVICTLPSAVR